MKLLGVAQIARIQAHLHVSNCFNVFLGVLLKLVNIHLIDVKNTANLLLEPFPLRILIAHNPLDKIGKCRLVLIVLDHAQTRQRAQLEALGLFIGIVHVVANVQNKTQDIHEGDRVSQGIAHLHDLLDLAR